MLSQISTTAAAHSPRSFRRLPATWLARALLLPLLIVLGPHVAGATMFVVSDAAALATKADAIALGTVRSVRARWDGQRVVSDVGLDVEQAVKGALPAHITLVAPGGKVGDVVMRVVDGAEFRVGDRSIVFMTAQDGVRRLFGLANGKLDVRRDGAEETVVWTRHGLAERAPLAAVLRDLRDVAEEAQP